MSSWMSWAFGKGGNAGGRDRAKETIINMRGHLLMLEKKEEHLNRRIQEETIKARNNATTNKKAALSALRQKKMYENDLEKFSGQRLTLEAQINAIESANMNLEHLNVMKEGASVLKSIHGKLDINKVDQTMESIQEQMQLTNEISEAISNPPAGMGVDVDEDELRAELDELEQEQLEGELAGAHSVPVHSPGRLEERSRPAPLRSQEEEDEEEELRQLQATLAM